MIDNIDIIQVYLKINSFCFLYSMKTRVFFLKFMRPVYIHCTWHVILGSPPTHYRLPGASILVRLLQVIMQVAHNMMYSKVMVSWIKQDLISMQDNKHKILVYYCVCCAPSLGIYLHILSWVKKSELFS